MTVPCMLCCTYRRRVYVPFDNKYIFKSISILSVCLRVFVCVCVSTVRVSCVCLCARWSLRVSHCIYVSDFVLHSHNSVHISNKIRWRIQYGTRAKQKQRLSGKWCKEDEKRKKESEREKEGERKRSERQRASDGAIAFVEWWWYTNNGLRDLL